MAAPIEIQNLVNRFTLHRKEYEHPSYGETETRREFIDPMFKALGWDIDNEEGNAESYKDVVHEDAIRIGTAIKAPDYSFRIGGTRKFFLEAKKPFINVKSDPSPAFQLRRYAWSDSLPLSIVTNFAELAVYDGRFKPVKSDKASKARTLYFTCEEYLEKWDEIAAIFSRAAVLKGAFDKYSESTRRKKGTSEVDEEFLEDIERWRANLAKNLALRNVDLTTRDLNFAVQRIIDRIIFLRIAEDRGIEDYGRLLGSINGDRIYKRLGQLFHAADDRYNSGIFHFTPDKSRREPPDEFTLSLKLDDNILRDMITGLYYPDSPYVFNVITADILGHVYEQFLGKVITLTAGHRAKVEEKPEVKKSGGVFYTPTYIVNYIVQQTIGKLLDGKTPTHAAKLKILDPACGSGSFLLGAYQYLLDWHLRWYMENESSKHKKQIYQDQRGVWRLTIAQRKQILLNNIYGVDIDSQAVEVTKLSLLLKVLEGATRDVLERQKKLFHERALPDLGNNIKCGNSLIGSDFYRGQQLSLVDDEDRRRINAFDWDGKDGFRTIMKAGGFDAVIGNPPYIFVREQIRNEERAYFASVFKLGWEKQNTFMLFMEVLLKLLNKNALGGFIVPNSWLTIESGKLLRQEFTNRLCLLADLNYAVFKKVSMEPSIFVLSGSRTREKLMVLSATNREEFVQKAPTKINRSAVVTSAGRFIVSEDMNVMPIVRRIGEQSIPLGDAFDVRTGLQAYEKGKGTPKQTAAEVKSHVFDRAGREDDNSYRYLEGRDVGRFRLSWSNMWMQYGPWLAQPREIGLFSRPRILIREITAPLPYCICAVFVADSFLNNKSILNVLHQQDSALHLKALACVLNSRLMSLVYKSTAVKSARKLFPKIVIKNLREFPIPAVWYDPSGGVDRLAAMADHIDTLKRKANNAKSPHEKNLLEREVDATDCEIDAIVYQMYGLTLSEIRLVDAATQP